MESNPQPVSPPLLRRYFYSGWAFFIPYLFFYLLYDWRKWPVNPDPSSHLPPLLHVYWALHVIHLFLGLLALRAWWREQRSNPSASLSAVALAKVDQLSTLNPQPSAFQSFGFSAFLPWALLALLFYIPGAYLEWPSDPWEHYARTNEWARYLYIGSHSAGYKSGYFISYSLLGWISPASRQRFWLDAYFTGTCLLLCWQYYRLARAVGLKSNASLVFVVLQAVLFGNDIFSFYRYYGIASTILSQLGAIALIRVGLDLAKSKSFVIRHSSFVIGEWLPSFLWSIASVSCLLALIAFNHVQGLGIAALGLAAVTVWRLLSWKRSSIWWLALAAMALSIAAVHWWPRHPALDQLYRPQGWLTRWYGFNILSAHSPAEDRTLQILGFFGILNFIAGLWLLLRRNHIVGWLTVMPVLALCFPFVAIPFANALARNQPGFWYIVSFHRMLLAIPVGLALAVVGAGFCEHNITAQETSGKREEGHPVRRRLMPFGSVILFLTLLVTVPVSGPYYNRLWNAFVTLPRDLSMDHVIASVSELHLDQINLSQPPRLIPTIGSSFVAFAIGAKNVPSTGSRVIMHNPLAYIPAIRTGPFLDDLASAIDNKEDVVLLVPNRLALYTPFSFAGCLSGHWFPQEVAVEHAAGPEIEAAAIKLGGKKIEGSSGAYYLNGSMRSENPSFAEGLSGWKKSTADVFEMSSAQDADGRVAAHLVTSGMQFIESYRIPVQRGQPYQVDTWVNVKKGAIRIQLLGSPDHKVLAKTLDYVTSGWVCLTLSTEDPVDTDFVTLSIDDYHVASEFYAGAIHLQSEPPENPSFEQGLAGWTRGTADVFEMSSAEAAGGRVSAHIVTSGVQFVESRRIPVERGKRYRVDAWVKVKKGAIRIQLLGHPDSKLLAEAHLVRPDDWVCLTLVTKDPVESDYVTLSIDDYHAKSEIYAGAIHLRPEQ